MDLPSLGLIALAAVGLGAAATYLIAQWLPAPVARLAAEHGRFQGLGEAVAATPRRRESQHEAINGIRTAN